MKKPGNRGETLVETLCALLVIVLLLTGLSAVILSSAQISRSAKAADTYCSMDKSGGALPGVSASVKWTSGGISYVKSMDICLYRDGEYYFYELD